jgi:pimeloyl-ACP methyl ester carboxylesterase
MVSMENAEISPFRVDVPQADLDDLRDRLARTRWPDELPGAGWDYGIPLDYTRELAGYWRTGYDWRVHEARLNGFGQFTTTIDGQRIHFPAAFGGSPGDAFDLVIPSIPGYGFSGPTHERGWDVRRVARAWATLMARLGYQRYGAQGGDWGAIISRELGLADPEHVAGVHVNMLLTRPPEDLGELTEEEIRRLQAARAFRTTGSGYNMIQATRPQTLAYGLADSPAGQLAWITEKFYEWTDGGLPHEAVDRDQLLTNVTLYWLTGTAGSSARLYYETRQARAWNPAAPSAVPMGVAVFPREIAPAIRRFAEQDNNIVHWSEFDRGGHFAAMEEPDLLVGDIRAFFRELRATTSVS